MRITNSMIANSSQAHITSAKNALLTSENQYTTQKKILRPSDDPSVAIRSLQLRTTYGQIEQYVEKNVQDAMEWMDVTETALKNINSILTSMKERADYGAQSYQGTTESRAILATLQEYATAIFEDEANTDYAGRYVFTGYRTDTSLIFPEETTNLEYEITQELTSNDIDTIKYVYGGANYQEGTTADEYAEAVPVEDKAYRLQLAYNNCSNEPITDSAMTDPISITLSTGDVLNVTTMTSADTNAYNPDQAGADAIYLYDTGEVVFSKDTYSRIHAEDASISITYSKKEFEKSDVRPEMYFACKSYNTTSEKTITYGDPSDQDIRYEVNFNQLSKVNTQAKDAISTDIYRMVDYIEQSVSAVETVEKKISEVEKLIANTTDDDKLADYNKLKEMLEQEQTLRQGVVVEAFGMALTMVDETQSQVNVAVADVGSRYNRLELTYDKLLDQKTDTEEKLSNNEDVDLADAYINLTQADNLYQASLSATAKILGNSLLNYI